MGATIEGFLTQIGPWADVLIFIIVALDSAAFLGFVLPGETVAILAGALAGAGFLNLWEALAIVTAAAIAGDISGYALGRYHGDALLAKWSFARRHYERHRQRLAAWFDRWGAATIVVGRFVSFGRALVPFAAGLSRMRARSFVPMAVVAGIIWGTAVIMLGYLLGSDWRRVEKWFRDLGVGLAAVTIFTVTMAILWRWAVHRQLVIIEVWRQRIVRPVLSHLEKYISPAVSFLRARVSPGGYLGIHLAVGLVALIGLAWLFGAMVHAIFAQKQLVLIDEAVNAYFRDARTNALDDLAAAIWLLAEPGFLCPMIACLALTLSIAHDRGLAVLAICVLGGAYGVGFGVRELFSWLYPQMPDEAIAHGFESFPSLAMNAATAAYGIMWFAVVTKLHDWRMQSFATIATIYILILIGGAGVYEGLYITGVIGGFALGGLWLMICLSGALIFARLSMPLSSPSKSRHTLT